MFLSFVIRPVLLFATVVLSWSQSLMRMIAVRTSSLGYDELGRSCLGILLIELNEG
jgi:hypothetical protein